ncbi:hypothetical protein BJV82DRAFT_615776 [Fennellomyces sp. T-0311]|nr:hypothetical protein BJV82DRAFT_615776 [Fennellomyces sp. T-0311]
MAVAMDPFEYHATGTLSCSTKNHSYFRVIVSATLHNMTPSIEMTRKPTFETTQDLIDQLASEAQAIRSSKMDLDVHEKTTAAQRMLEQLTISHDTVDPITQELQDRFAQLQAEADAIKAQSEKSQEATLLREKEQLDQSIKDTVDETKDLKDEIRRLRQELYELESHDDEIELDEIDLRLHLYRDLGIRMLAKDGKFTTAMLTNGKNQTVNAVDTSKGYSPYYLADIIWKFIS